MEDNELILGLRPADERRCYQVTPSLMGTNLESALNIHHDDRASRKWTTAGGWQAMGS